MGQDDPKRLRLQYLNRHKSDDRMSERIGFTVNGMRVELTVDEDRPLLRVIRTDLGLTGTKYGCGEGFCRS